MNMVDAFIEYLSGRCGIYVLQRLGLKINLLFFHIKSISSITVLFPFAFQTETVYVCRRIYIYLYIYAEMTSSVV
jgi:hypothetical protein